MPAGRGVLSALLLLALAMPAPADASGLRPRPGTLVLGPEQADPADGGRWTVRSWRPQRGDTEAFPPRPARCLHVGRPDGVNVVRVVRGELRAMRWRDRTVCGTLDDDPRLGPPPLLVERLLADQSAPPLQTIVAGLVGQGETRVLLHVAGVARELSRSSSSAACGRGAWTSVAAMVTTRSWPVA